MGKVNEIPVLYGGNTNGSNPLIREGIFGSDSPTGVSKVLPIDERKYVDDRFGTVQPYHFNAGPSKRNDSISLLHQNIGHGGNGVAGGRSGGVSGNF